MPIDILLDPDTGDLPAISRFVTGIDLVHQRIRRRLQRHRGEWFLDPAGTGLPYEVWRQQKPPNLTEILGAVRRELAAIPEVTSTAGWEITHDNDTNRLTITGTLFTDYGVTGIRLSEPEPTTADHHNAMVFAAVFIAPTIFIPPMG
jgi:hypothetical protein